jgi:hypothetical protein
MDSVAEELKVTSRRKETNDVCETERGQRSRKQQS